MLPTRLAALAAISLALMTFNAEARQSSPMTCFNGDRYVDCGQITKQTSNKTASRQHRSSRPSKHAVRPSNEAPIALGSGIVRSQKTGATARVGVAHRAVFQAYVNAIEAAGGAVRFMGGIRPGPCWTGGLHPCGKALDVCQLARGVVDRRCNLPSKSVMAAIARNNGLVEGGVWCHGDYGHAQVGGVGACRSTLYSAVSKFKKKHHVKYASRHSNE